MSQAGPWEDFGSTAGPWEDYVPDTGAQAATRRTAMQELLRQAGLTARYGIEGLAGIPGLVLDPFQKVLKTPTVSQAGSAVADIIGLPKPETPTEQVAAAGSRAIAGGAGTAALARGIPALMQLGPEAINNVLARYPLQQTLQAGIGGVAAEGTKQAGGNELAQIGASAVAPLAVTGAYQAAAAAGRGIREIARPVTQGGAAQIAADVLGEVASDKQAALRNLQQYNAMKKLDPNAVGVPGSRPTSGAVSADYGLIGGEQLAARGQNAPDFARRTAENNAARLEELAKLRATKEQLAAYELRRDQVSAPLREAAFNQAEAVQQATGFKLPPVDYTKVAGKVGEVLATPEGGRVESQKALKWLVERLQKYQQEGRTDPRNAYELYKDIGDLVAGKVTDTAGSALRLAGGLANSVKQELGRQIENSAPGFQKYLETYSRLSKPIDRLEVLIDKFGGQDLSRITNALPMASELGPLFQLSQAKMRNAVGNIEGTLPIRPKGLPLAPYQENVLGRVMGDLNSQELALRGGKPPGSDTYQNMATANLLTSIFGRNLAEAGLPKVVTAPLNFAYKPLEQRVRNLVDEAYLDPVKMEALLKIARTRRNSPTLFDALTSAETNIYGGLLGGQLR